MVDSCSFHGRRAQSRGRAGADASVRRPPLRGGSPVVLAAWGKSANSPLGTGAQTVRTWGASAQPQGAALLGVSQARHHRPTHGLAETEVACVGWNTKNQQCATLARKAAQAGVGARLWSAEERSGVRSGRLRPKSALFEAMYSWPSLRTCLTQRAPQGSRRAASTAPVKRPGACLRSLARHVGGNACHLSRRPEISPDNP